MTPSVPWTEEELALVRRYRPTMTFKLISKHFLPRRSPDAIRRVASKMGVYRTKTSHYNDDLTLQEHIDLAKAERDTAPLYKNPIGWPGAVTPFKFD